VIRYKSGNLLDDNVEALVNTVNCVGIMGKGVALQFKQAYPDNFKDYEKACKKKEVQLGRMHVFQTGSLLYPRYIINFPTKNHWRAKSELEDIKKGIEDLIKTIRELKIKSIAIPPLGCGLGGLNWQDVRQILINRLGNLQGIEIDMFQPAGSPPPEEINIKNPKPGLTRARALFIYLLHDYALSGYKISLLELQKLAYFLQQAGEPLRLDFSRHKYGPYAHNLNHVLKVIEGHYICGYGDGTSRAGEQTIYLLPEAFMEAAFFLENENGNETKKNLEKVQKLIRGFDTPYGLELLATVHWTIREYPDTAHNIKALTDKVKSWSKRKEMLFTESHIEKSMERLKAFGMVPHESTL